MARWRTLEEYTPVARLLVDYMWEQRPPLLPSQFAARMGLPKQLVSSWLSGQATPSPAVLLHLARRMELPVSQLLIAAGYTQDTDPLLDIPEAWSHVLHAVRLYQEQRPGSEREEESASGGQLEALLQAVQTLDLEAWRSASIAQEETGAEGAFWSRRRRRSEPLEATGDAATEESEESED